MPRSRRSPLRLEALERRDTPATILVTSTADSGAGSLRAAITQANNTVTNPGLDDIVFNLSGPGVHVISLASPLPVVTDPLNIDGYSQPGSRPNTDPSAFNGVLNVRLDCTFTQPGHALQFRVGGNTVRGLNITNATSSGIFLNAANGVGGNVVQGNLLGTDAEGSAGLGNQNNLFILDSGNTIGGRLPADRNVLSGAGNAAVLLTGGADNVIVGNLIGTNPAGTAAVAGQSFGVFLSQNVRDTRIGGPDPADRNVIAAGRGAGITVGNALPHVIQGNRIGTDVTGTVAIPNFIGINLGHGGGAAPLIDGNLIADNTSDGIAISNGTAVEIRNNTIRGNAGMGINHFNGSNTYIHNNLIAQNGTTTLHAGVRVHGDGADVRVQGNEIRDNVGDGVFASSLPGAPRKLIGGRAAGEGNAIFANGQRGVYVQFGEGIEIVGNSMANNGRLGIALGGGGIVPTPNDPTDTDTGPNGLQNYPVLTVAESRGARTFVQATLASLAGTYTFDVYAVVTPDPTGFGEGLRYLGSLTDGLGTFSGEVGATTPGEFLCVTATDANGNTSEFSGNRVVVQGNRAPVANPDGYTVANAGTLSPPAPGVLGNDTDADDDRLTAVLVRGPAHARSFTLHADGSFTYVHDGSATTSDSFTYRANDGTTDGNETTVSLTITPVAGEHRLTIVLDDPATPGIDVIVADDAPAGFATPLGPTTHPDLQVAAGGLYYLGPVGRFRSVVGWATGRAVLGNQLLFQVAPRGGPGTLIGMASDTGYAGVAGTNVIDCPIGGVTFGRVTFVETVDPENALFATAAQATTLHQGPFTGGGFSGTGQIPFTLPAGGLFSLTKTLVIEHAVSTHTGVSAMGSLRKPAAAQVPADRDAVWLLVAARKGSANRSRFGPAEPVD